MTTELELELRARALVGETIARVDYQQLRWSTQPAGVVEVAIFIAMSSHKHFRIGWADALRLHHGHHLTIDPIRRIDGDGGPLVPAAWPHRTIVGATLHWGDVDEALRSSLSIMVAIGGDHLRRCDFPQTLQLDLDDGSRVFVSCALENRLVVTQRKTA